MDNPPLKRRLTLPLLSLYGIGAILGAGIYVLIGEVTASAGIYAPLSFLLAAVVAGITGFSYCELSARIPRSAGEAIYIDKAFANPQLTRVVGLLVVFTGLVSAATMATGIVGYWQLFIDWPALLIISIFIIVISLIACWGIREAAWLITLITLIEISGLIMVLWVGIESEASITLNWPELKDHSSWHGIMLGGFLAFYAYIGFEDMVNVAEEVERPKHNLPLAIIIALLASTLLYMAVAIVALAVVPSTELASHPAPLAQVVSNSGYNSQWLAGISMVAIINGALVQLIMASRVLYGMAVMQRLPRSLARIHPLTSTPITATLWSSLLIWLLAWALPLASLAKTTSFIILIIFCLVNSALLQLKRRPDKAPSSGFQSHSSIPSLGLLLCLVMLLFQSYVSLIN